MTNYKDKENNRYKVEAYQKEIKEYTIFERKSNCSGIEMKTNFSNYIGKTDLDTLNRLQDKTNIFKNVLMPYTPSAIEQYAEKLRLLRKYNNLKIPDAIYGVKDLPAAFVWGGVVYIIAPRIEE